MSPGRLWRTTATALLAVVALGLSAGPAHAADELQLSADGTSWSSSLTSVLFPHAQALVPGDVVTTSLWVRNASGDQARIDLDVADALGVVPGTLAGDLTLTIDGAAAAGGSRWRGPVLAPGASLRIPLVLTFDAASQATSRLDVSAVLDAAILVQTGVGPGAVAPSTPDTAPTGGPTPVAAASQARRVGTSRTPARTSPEHSPWRSSRSAAGYFSWRLAVDRDAPSPDVPAAAARTTVRLRRSGEQWVPTATARWIRPAVDRMITPPPGRAAARLGMPSQTAHVVLVTLAESST